VGYRHERLATCTRSFTRRSKQPFAKGSSFGTSQTVAELVDGTKGDGRNSPLMMHEPLEDVLRRAPIGRHRRATRAGPDSATRSTQGR
jgi:hypothetical protein